MLITNAQRASDFQKKDDRKLPNLLAGPIRGEITRLNRAKRLIFVHRIFSDY